MEDNKYMTYQLISICIVVMFCFFHVKQCAMHQLDTDLKKKNCVVKEVQE